MALSTQMRLLMKKWESNLGWPKRLDSLRLTGIRGFSGQRIEFPFPIMAIVGENGAGKSTILQAAASVYQKDAPDEREYFPTDFFPDTIWEPFHNSEIEYSCRQGPQVKTDVIRKLKSRWRGYDKRPQRFVEYQDLSRAQPFATKIGYGRLAEGKEERDKVVDNEQMLSRFSRIMGRVYDFVGSARTEVDDKRRIPLYGVKGRTTSGFHQGMGEISTQIILGIKPRKYELLLIDEVETALHPRAQRELMRDLAALASALEIQVILTTHSPYILSELPEMARLFVMRDDKTIMRGVSPEFAMTQMDDTQHPDCDIYVEDPRSEALLREILIEHSSHVGRCRFIPFGTASVGFALGQMIDKFPRKSFVYLDADQRGTNARGCHFLPGNDAPEIVVFRDMSAKKWDGVAQRLGREVADVIDALEQARVGAYHHEWVRTAAITLKVGSDQLWQALCSCWAKQCLDQTEAETITRPIDEHLGTISVSSIEQPPLALQFPGDDAH